MENYKLNQNDTIVANLRNFSPEISEEFLLEIRDRIYKNINTTESLILENNLSDAITMLENQRKYKNIFKKFVLENEKCNRLIAYDLGCFDGVYTTLIEFINKIITLKDKQEVDENILSRKYVMDILLFVYKNPLSRHKTISEKIGVKPNYLNELMNLLIKKSLVNKYQSGKYSIYSLTDKGILYMKDRQKMNIHKDPFTIKNYKNNYYVRKFPAYKTTEDNYQVNAIRYFNKTNNFVSDNQQKNYLANIIIGEK